MFGHAEHQIHTVRKGEGPKHLWGDILWCTSCVPVLGVLDYGLAEHRYRYYNQKK